MPLQVTYGLNSPDSPQDCLAHTQSLVKFKAHLLCRFYTVRFVAKLATELAAGASQAANSADDEHGDEDADKRRRLSRANGDVSHRASIAL